MSSQNPQTFYCNTEASKVSVLYSSLINLSSYVILMLEGTGLQKQLDHFDAAVSVVGAVSSSPGSAACVSPGVKFGGLGIAKHKTPAPASSLTYFNIFQPCSNLFHCKLLKCFKSPTRNHTSNSPLRRIPRQPRNLQKRSLALQALRVNLRDFMRFPFPHFKTFEHWKRGFKIYPKYSQIIALKWYQVWCHHIFSLRGQGELVREFLRLKNQAWMQSWSKKTFDFPSESTARRQLPERFQDKIQTTAPLTIADANSLVNCWLYGGTAMGFINRAHPAGIVQLVALFSN